MRLLYCKLEDFMRGKRLFYCRDNKTLNKKLCKFGIISIKQCLHKHIKTLLSCKNFPIKAVKQGTVTESLAY